MKTIWLVAYGDGAHYAGWPAIAFGTEAEAKAYAKANPDNEYGGSADVEEIAWGSPPVSETKE